MPRHLAPAADADRAEVLKSLCRLAEAKGTGNNDAGRQLTGTVLTNASFLGKGTFNPEELGATTHHQQPRNHAPKRGHAPLPVG